MTSQCVQQKNAYKCESVLKPRVKIEKHTKKQMNLTLAFMFLSSSTLSDLH
jgi:hypothetical protein